MKGNNDLMYLQSTDHIGKRGFFLLVMPTWYRLGVNPFILMAVHIVSKFTSSVSVWPGGTPYSGLHGEAPPKRGAFFKLAVYEKVGKIAILVYERVTKSGSCKVEEMVAKANYFKGCHILAEMTTQLNQKD